MENAVKALSMAGSVLLSLLIIVLVIFYYDSLRFNEEMKKTRREEREVDSINTQFETYLTKKYLIGSEVLSLANLAQNYNTPEYLSNGYDAIVLNVDLVQSLGLVQDSKLFGGNFRGKIADDGITYVNDIYTAYKIDNKKMQDALDKQYANSSKTEFKYGGHSFEFWFQWMDSVYQEPGDNDSYRKFYKKYREIADGVILSDKDIDDHLSMLNDATPKNLWNEAYKYAEKKNTIIDFSRLNFEVKDVVYNERTGRIQKIEISEVE